MALQDRLGGGSDVQYHHANKGGSNSSVRRLRLEQRGKLCGRSGWKQLLVGSGLIQHWMQQVNPCVRIRLTHPKELSLHVLNGILFHVRQHEAQFVRDHGQRTGAIGRIAATRARLSINRAILPGGHKRLLKMGQQGLKLGVRESGQ